MARAAPSINSPWLSSSTSPSSSLSSKSLLLFRRRTWARRPSSALPVKEVPTSGVRAATASAVDNSLWPVSRRRACLEMAAALATSSAPLATLMNSESASAREVEVGSYLPSSLNDPRFVQYRASSRDTPALRAGNVQPYEFHLPPTWKQERVANILSGNYCQPKCAEPWVEVKFADSKQGAIQVVAAPMVRLTNKPNATIEEIGSPDKILAALGPFVTGNTYDPEEVMETYVQRRGDQTYYNYELETPFARTGAHNLASATAKGSVVMLFVISASDAQWSSSEKLLRSIMESFGV